MAPTFESAATSAEGWVVTIRFSENVQVPSELRTLSSYVGVDVGVLFQAVFDIFVDGNRAHTTGATMTNGDLKFRMDSTILQGQEVTRSYNNIFARDVAGLLVDDVGNVLGEFSDEPVTNNSTFTDDGGSFWPVISAQSLSVLEGYTGHVKVLIEDSE